MLLWTLSTIRGTLYARDIFLQKSSKPASPELFADFCFTANYMQMFGDIENFKIILPFVCENHEIQSGTMIPQAKIDNKTSLSVARQRSGGDGAHGGGDSC